MRVTTQTPNAKGLNHHEQYNTQRYLPHEISTKVHAVEMYRQTASVPLYAGDITSQSLTHALKQVL